MNTNNSDQNVKNLSHRKLQLIYPRFQLALIVSNSLITLLTFSIVLLGSHFTFSKFIATGQSIHLPDDHSYFKLIDLQKTRFYSNVIIVFIISMVISNLVTVFLSHRLAGPIVRTKEFFKKIIEEKNISTKLKFRKKDFFEDLPEVVNSALEAITKK